MPTPVAPAGGFVNGGWYSGQQYWDGTFSAPGVINSKSNQVGAGQAVSAEVNAQSAKAQGVTPQNFNNYLQQQSAAPANPVSAPVAPTQVNGGSVNPSVGGGGGAAPLSIPQAPTFDLVKATESAYNTPEIQGAQKAIADRQSALAKAQAEINDNPFYSEATRVGKSAKLTEQANADIKVQQDLLTSLHADAAIKLAAQQGQYNINEQTYKDSLDRFNSLVSQGALDNASAGDLANLAVQTGIPVSMIQSIATASSNKNNPVSIVQSTDNAGNLSILAVDKTGKIVNQTTIAGAGKATTTGSNAKPGSTEYVSNAIAKMAPAVVATLNSYGDISPQDWNKALAAWLAQGLSKDDFIKNFGQYADTNRGDFVSVYGFKNPDQ